jgi:hypothetical protein
MKEGNQMSYEDNEMRGDGKSEIWEIEKRMIATPGYNLPDRETLNKMFAIITMDADIRLHTNDEELIGWWLEQGVPDEAVENGEWDTIESMVEDEQDYQNLKGLYQAILKRR